MVVPLFLEQFLVMPVGIADTLVASYAGEAADARSAHENTMIIRSYRCPDIWKKYLSDG